jgi:DNA-binding LacI/PurR family transcriptional regulator
MAPFFCTGRSHESGYHIVLTTAEKPGPLVAVDNAGGIRQAFDHLWQHGHRRIAFIAGKSGRGGDSAERLSMYRGALRDAGVEEDARLIVFEGNALPALAAFSDW